MPGGRKAKKAKHRNISGLKNQSKSFPSQSDSTPHPTPPRSEAPSPDLSEVEDELETKNEYELLNYFDRGWCKYRYREHPKANFAAAKERALQVLDACPVEVIRRFINRSGRFLEAYRSGLTGKAAAWAVKKQKQHRVVSERAMVAMENVNTHILQT